MPDVIKILYIEDDEQQRQALTGQLVARGWSVCAVSGGLEGLDRLQSDSFDVLLCDLHMPEMDGFRVLEETRRLRPDLPVIFLTAHGSIELGVKAIKLGAHHFISKPIDLGALEVTVQQAVEHAEMQQRLAESEQHLQLLMETVPDIIYSLDLAGNFLSVNAAGEQILGYAIADVLGTSVFNLVLPEDRARLIRGIEHDVAEKNSSTRTLEFRMIAKTGEVKHFEVKRRLIFDGDTCIRNDGIARDVTERKRLEAKILERTASLSQVNAELQAILDASPSAIIMVSDMNEITSYNRAASDFFGIPGDELSGLSWNAFQERIELCFEKPDAFLKMIDQLRQDPDACCVDQDEHHNALHRSLLVRSPRPRQVSVASMPVVSKQDLVLGRMWIFTDVTRLKEADEQLHKIVEVSPVPLIITRLSDGKILFANEHLGALVGYSPAELLRHSAADFYADPPERRAVIDLLQRDGQLKNYEIRFRRRDGTVFWTILSLVVSELQGEAVVIGGVHDIDRRREMEDALRWERNFVSAVLDTAGALVLVVDTSGRIVRFNKACQDTTGFSGEEVLGQHFWDIFLVPEEMQEVREVFKDLRAGQFPQAHENFWLTKDGSRRRIAWSNTALTDDTGSVEYIIATGIDITEHKRALQDLERANQDLKDKQSQLVQSEKMASLGMLVAGIAHELNTPIGAVSSMHNTLIRSSEKLRALLQSEAPELYEQNRRLKLILQAIDDANQVIESGSDRVTTIVRRLRSFARLDEAALKVVDIHEGLEDTLTIIHHEIKHKITLNRNYGDIPRIPCFPGPLNQVFLNLLINANQAIQDKGEITITTSARGDRIYIEIADTGHGMTPEVVRQIFDPGFTTKGVGVGTGLGLSICYQIVQDHHGEIRVASQPGKGSTFTLILPTNLDVILGQSI